MNEEVHRVSVPLWRWEGENGAWHFISVDGAAAEALHATALMRRLESGRRAGFGSVRLTIRVGKSTWQTSAFPLRESGWSIPIANRYRKAEGLIEGSTVKAELRF